MHLYTQDSAEDVASRLARKFPEHVGARMVKPSQLVSVVKKLQRLLIVVPTSRDERDGTSAFKEQHTDGGKAAWTIATQQQEGRYQQQPRSPERNHDPLVLQPLSLSVPSNAHPPSPPLESQSISSTAPTNATVSSEQHTSGHRPSGVEVLPTGVQEGILNHIRDGTTSHVNEEEVVTGLGGRGEEDTHVRRGLTTRRGVVVGGTLAQQTEGVLPSPNIASMSDGYKSSLQKTDRCLLPGDKLMAQGAQTSQLLHGKIGETPVQTCRVILCVVLIGERVLSVHQRKYLLSTTGVPSYTIRQLGSRAKLGVLREVSRYKQVKFPPSTVGLEYGVFSITARWGRFF